MKKFLATLLVFVLAGGIIAWFKRNDISTFVGGVADGRVKTPDAIGHGKNGQQHLSGNG